MNNNKTQEILASAPLGKKSAYINTYTPSLLFPLPRKPKRDELGIFELLPFRGVDLWTGYEVSWLNPKGKPVVALAQFEIPAESEMLIESKSFKLYLNSFNNSKFQNIEQVQDLMTTDLSNAAQAPVVVRLYALNESPLSLTQVQQLAGTCIDDLDIECTEYQPNISYLNLALGAEAQAEVHETLHTHLLKSNCLVTGQPDWGSVEVSYKGPQIDSAGLLRYIVSLRDHNEFHEQCVERIFMAILQQCKPRELTVYARYTRRGGLDINPYRTNAARDQDDVEVPSIRLLRQ